MTPAAPAGPALLHDLRFSALLGAEAWARLPHAIRERFGRRLGGGAAITYAGQIVESRRNAVGRLAAEACRLIGAPLPLHDRIGAPAVVTVIEDGVSGGQFWTRLYGCPHGFPQVIHSSKRFAGPTGLEEYLGLGFGIALTLSADHEALRFHSDHYFLGLGRWRWRLPDWLGPGRLTITHLDKGDGAFAFVLDLHHPLGGELISQTGLFRERAAFVPKEREND
jgi:hypothetical protein